MEKLYTQEEYQLQAEQANKDGLFLYQLVKEQEYTIEVLEYEKKIVSQDIYSEDGEIIDSQEVEVDDLTKPIMVEEEITNPETGKKETVIVQKHHTETRTKTVVELAIEPKGYYVCFKDNYTNGEINPYYEAEKAQRERERINLLSMTKREMFLGLYQAKQITPDILKAKITDPQALIEFEYANDYYRGNPLIDIIGAQLGFTSEQLDKFFETKDYIYLIPSEQVSDQVTDIVTEQVEVQDENTTDYNESDISI